MSRAITETELGKLRSGNQWSQLYLAIHKPATVYTARVNQAIFNDELVSITYDGGSGSLADVLVGMTMFIGSSAGAKDKGVCRIRKTPSETVFYIGETGELAPEDDDYITVIDEFRIWSRHIALQGTEAFMDYDVEYSDQHTNLDPVPVLGSHAVLWLTGATVVFYPDASDSWILGDTIASYLWTAPGASATSDLNTATPTITYNAVGTYRVGCTITATNGNTAVGYRYVFIYDDDNMPTTQFKLNSCSGDREEGGWGFSISLYDEASITDIQEQALIILFAKDFYNGIQESLGELAGYENIISIGRVINEDLEYSANFSTVNFQVKGSHYWLSKIPGYPIGMEYAESSSTWTEMDSLTVDRALWHLLHWRSTATLCVDISLTESDLYASVLEASVGSLWTQLITIAEETLLAKPVFDRYDRLFVEVHPSFMIDADRTSIPTVMEITKEDYTDQYSLERKIVHDTSMIEVSGISFDGTTASPLFSRAPGRVLSRFGSVVSVDRLLLEDQDHCNYLAGYLYANQNNEYPNLDIALAENNRFIDITPNQRLTMSLLTIDFPRGLSYTNKKFLPNRVEYQHEEQSGIITTRLELEGETTLVNSKSGVTIIPPQPVEENIDPGVDSGEFPIFPFPNINFPPILPIAPPADPDCLIKGSGIYRLIFNPSSLISKPSEEVSTTAYFPCNIRSTGNYPTVFRLEGLFYKWSSTYQSYQLYNGYHDFYRVEAIDDGGNVVAAASGVREIDVDTTEFVFSLLGNVNISGIRITIYADDDQHGFGKYTIEELVSSGSINVKSESGITFSGLGVDSWYAVRGTGGSYNTDPSVSPNMQKYTIQLNHDGGWNAVIGADRTSPADPWSYFQTLGFGSYARIIESVYGILVFKAANTNISIRAYDVNNWDDNVGSIGYALYNVHVDEMPGYKMNITGAGLYNICPTL